MTKYLLLFAIFSIALLACEDEPVTANECFTSDPVQELAWLDTQIQNLEGSVSSEFLYVSQNDYNDMVVFIFGNCCPYCNYIIPVYNCAVEFIGNVGNGTDSIDQSVLDDDQIIWKGEGSECEG